jgi:hypothetical protein
MTPADSPGDQAAAAGVSGIRLRPMVVYHQGVLVADGPFFALVLGNRQYPAVVRGGVAAHRMVNLRLAWSVRIHDGLAYMTPRECEVVARIRSEYASKNAKRGSVGGEAVSARRGTDGNRRRRTGGGQTRVAAARYRRRS